MKTWVEPEAVSVPRSLREAIGGHPLVAETLVRRGITTLAEARAFLDPDHYHPTPAAAMPGMEAAASRVELALGRAERICVWGDFDVDGQTATTVLVSTLQDLGGDVIFHIPVRETESHGIKQPWLEEALAKGVGLLVTCDTGVDAHDAVVYAGSQGVDVVITDHHELPERLPDAAAIVNPHLLPEDHALSTLPGVGVAYKLSEMLYERAGRPEAAERFLDLVALGIVADVAVQTGDARYLLQRGLRALQKTSRLGLQELMTRAGVQPDSIDEETIGFALGPRLNALGRLGDANVIVEFLTTGDLGRARFLASQLESLNSRRQLLCDQIYAAAEAELERTPSLLESSALVMLNEHWPPGVIGIVAHRLVERYHRPVVLLTTASSELARGSARSIPGCHITQAIATQSDLLEGFGGHAMAAGLTIDPELVPEFRRGLARAVSDQLASGAAEPVLQIHGWVTLGELSLTLVSELRRLAPFGPGNPSLVLATRDLEAVAQRTLGRKGHHLRVTVADREKVERNVVWWNWRGASLPEGRFDLAFNARLNEFRGEVSVQVVWEDAQPARGAEVPLAVAVAKALEIVDYRDAKDPAQMVRSLLEADSSVEIWAEGSHGAPGPARHRLDLSAAHTLVIWSSPPGLEALQIALRRVEPARIVLVAEGGDLDQAEAFLKHLGGMVKHALRERDGRVSLAEFAAALGHREASIRKGLELWAAQGAVQVTGTREIVAQLSEGRGVRDQAVVRQLTAELRQVLAETIAYRLFFAKVDRERAVAGLLPGKA